MDPPDPPDDALPHDGSASESADLPSPLRPGEVLRLILPAFVVSTLVAAGGVALVAVGHRTLGVVLVVIAAVGGISYRARLVLRAQQRGGRPFG